MNIIKKSAETPIKKEIYSKESKEENPPLKNSFKKKRFFSRITQRVPKYLSKDRLSKDTAETSLRNQNTPTKEPLWIPVKESQ